MNNKEHRYFPNLDGLRFLGSLAIIFFHTEGIKKLEGVGESNLVRYFTINGNHAVSLFFVLSGFLITYLLLNEKEKTGTIGLKNFYIRRILKIWPLYFLIGVLGFFLLPYISTYFADVFNSNVKPHFGRTCLLYLLFLPLAVKTAIGYVWSVRVEEMFYLAWPLILKRAKNYMAIFLIVIVGIIVVRNIVEHAGGIITHDLNELARDYRFSCMAMGGIAACLYISGHKVLNVIFRKDVQWALYAITLLMLTFKVMVPFASFEVYALLFACIVVNLATNPASVVKLDYKWMNYLGKISYGLYMYNPIMRVFSLGLTQKIMGDDAPGWEFNLVLYSFTIASTIIVAILSYQFFEKYFLRMKTKFN